MLACPRLPQGKKGGVKDLSQAKVGAGGTPSTREVGVAAAETAVPGCTQFLKLRRQAASTKMCAWWRPAASCRPLVPASHDRQAVFSALLSLELQEESGILKIVHMVATRCLIASNTPPCVPLFPAL